MGVLAERTEGALIRPLSELKPLILAKIEQGDEAGIPHYTEAGALLIEARCHEWKNAEVYWEWATRSVRRKKRQLEEYIALAKDTAAGKFRVQPRNLEEAKEITGRSTQADRRENGWQAPVQEKLQAFNWDRYNQDQADKAKEQAMINKLILEMLDIGYKVLAAKFHPDKSTGSKEAMARLNEARRQAKGLVS